MVFTETKLRGAYIIEIERMEDKRGFLARCFCANEFSKHGLKTRIVQSNISSNKKAGTLRGMHYQAKPYEEAKLVSCIRGSIYDVIIDLRPGTSTYCQWFSVELSAENGVMLYIPEGFAHGFQTMEDNSTVFYQMYEFYHPDNASGLRWDDPLFVVQWPEMTDRIISIRDKNYPDYVP